MRLPGAAAQDVPGSRRPKPSDAILTPPCAESAEL